MVGKEVAVMAEVIDSYLEGDSQLWQAIRTAADTGDAPGLHYTAHTLKSSSRTLGAIGLYPLCQESEDISKGSTTIAASALVSQVEAEYERVEATLQAQ
jgi:HPt (histidine-containing phosphotransfer) domain-containing protein